MFFFTGDFYRTPENENIIKKLIENGHYLGAHSDKHLLYAPWEKRDSLLLTQEEFIEDLKSNYEEMRKFGIEKNNAKYFLPPYEWYNQEIANWTNALGLTLINYTPGTYSNADYTYPEQGENYLSSQEIFKRILKYEEKDPNGLNGFFLLTHVGTDERRSDKFYNYLDKLISELKVRGYSFTKLE
jgi:peptidoglycan/xylan/chitin deacetylase (PgdA/CDA1 family)